MKIKAYHKDLNHLHVGCEDPRAYFIPYQSEDDALAGVRDNSAYFTNLCGEWNFNYYNSLTELCLLTDDISYNMWDFDT